MYSVPVYLNMIKVLLRTPYYLTDGIRHYTSIEWWGSVVWGYREVERVGGEEIHHQIYSSTVSLNIEQMELDIRSLLVLLPCEETISILGDC
jgi:hypothetical protein